MYLKIDQIKTTHVDKVHIENFGLEMLFSFFRESILNTNIF